MTYDLSTHITGDTFNGQDFIISRKGEPFPLNDVLLSGKVYNKDFEYILSEGTEIIKNQNVPGGFGIARQIISFEPGTYDYYIEFTFQNIVKTLTDDAGLILTDDAGLEINFYYLNGMVSKKYLSGKWEIIKVGEIIDPIVAPLTYPLLDIDGNEYTTRKINDQEWLGQNFMVTHYSDGSPITHLVESYFDDWFLPSRNELSKMHINLHKGIDENSVAYSPVGGFSPYGYYWSSTEFNAMQAYGQFFHLETQSYGNKTGENRVRACRSFVGSVVDYPLRSIGPAGGLIFAHFDGLAYEAALEDQSAGKAWSDITGSEIGTTGTAIGTGKTNTDAIINQATTLFNDYFLPSKNELNKMYVNLDSEGIGNFVDAFYWSSSEYAANYAYIQSFVNGAQMAMAKGDLNIKVRACRFFTADVGSYVLGDTGPAGGLIFHILGNIYYEAAPSDQGTVAWSDIVNVEIGVTAQYTAIGYGTANTSAILNQSATAPAAKLCNDLEITISHTDSAAKLCNDLEAGGWKYDQAGAYCTYDNDINRAPVYGLEYNFPAINNVANLAYLERGGIQELRWRIPTKADFVKFIAELGGSDIAGGQMKIDGQIYWNSPNTGATNSSGFTARGAGFRDENGDFFELKTLSVLATSEEYDVDHIWAYVLYNDEASLTEQSNWHKNTGFSVRLVRDIL